MKHLADHHSRAIEIDSGEGCYLFDRDGKRFLDFLAGWCVGNVGWKRAEVLKAIGKEAERGIYVPPVLRFQEQEAFAAILVEHAPGKKLTRVFRCTSGSEAVEFAIKCARAATGKKTIVSLDGVYHGHTYGAASVGDAVTSAIAPGVPGFVKLHLPNPYRIKNSSEIVQGFEKLIQQNHDIAAFLSEPVFTNAGSIVPHQDFYPAIQKLCQEHNILLVMDEVATGFGRCGKLFASELWGLEPDIVCLGKGITGGYGTLGATMVSEKVFERSRNLPQYSTFGWLPLDLAAALANVEVILKEQLWEHASEVGSYLLERLKPLERFEHVGEVRGIGLLLGIEIVKDKKSKQPDYRRADSIMNACTDQGLLIETAGNVLFITPPLILSKEQADEGAGIVEKVMKIFGF